MLNKLLIVYLSIAYFIIFSGYNQNCYYVQGLNFLHCWGSNQFGEGVMPDFSRKEDIEYLSIGRMYVCAVCIKSKDYGALHCWGNNEYGQYSFQDDIMRMAKSVEAGDMHTCIKNAGSYIDCVGLNTYGQCDVNKQETVKAYKVRGNSTLVLNESGLRIYGDASFYSKNYVKLDPVNINSRNVALGLNFYCVYSSDMNINIFCDGENQYNQLEAPKIDSFVLSSYSQHVCSISDYNEYYNEVNCWGNDTNLHNDYELTPNQYNSIETGQNHACYTIGYDYVECIGSSEYNVIKIPRSVRNFTTEVSTGGEYTCMRAGGAIKCVGKSKNNLTEVPEYYKYGTISTGYNHMCGTSFNYLQKVFDISCWGLKNKREIEIPDSFNIDYYNVYDMNSGYKFNCAIRSITISKDIPNTILCWGLNDYGQTDFPYSKSEHNSTSFQEVSAGIGHACAVYHSKQLVCWGLNNKKQASVPPNTSSNIRTVSAGYYHTCAVTEANYGFCFGMNNSGQVDIPYHLLGKVYYVFSGGSHSCALGQDMRSVCWGNNRHKQLDVPRALGMASMLALGEKHSCSMHGSGVTRCWGDNTHGQLNLKDLIAG